MESSYINDRFVDNTGVPYDLDFLGELSENGALPEQYGHSALANAIKLWILSQKGETFRSLNRGGFVYQYLNKPMTQVSPDEIKHSIRDGIDIDWRGNLQLLFIEVQPNYEQKGWKIQLQVYSPTYKIFDDLELTVKSSG